MGHALASSIASFGSLSVLLAMLVGMATGLVGGLLPGLSSVTILTLLIPFIYHMSIPEALALILSSYAVFTITGDINSALVGIPSHPECAALIMDGYPMTRRGEGARAIGAVITSCGIGALIGCVFLALVGPLLRPLIVGVGPPQLFALLMVGLAMVGSLSGRKIIAGVAAAMFGVLLSTIGSSDLTGILRYGFGQVYLVQGLSLVAVALGIFAIPAVMDMHVNGQRGIGGERPSLQSDHWTGVRDVVTRPVSVIRGSLVGSVVGVVPGLGGAVAQWAAYGQAAQSSKHPETFGEGDIDGVIAPSAACNAKEGGSLLPTIAFGVPGSAAMAILLAVFTVLGITPGPALLGEHLDTTYFMVLVILLANTIGCVICFLVIKPLARVAFIRGAMLAPIIICLLFIGAGSATGQWGDIFTMLVAGGVGFAFRWAGWSPIPLVVGFVLGRSVENSLWLSIHISGAAWLTDPVVIILLAIAVGMVVVTWLRRRRITRQGGSSQLGSMGAGPGTRDPRRDAMHSLAVSCGVIAIGVVALIIPFAQGWTLESWLLPVLAAGTMTALSTLELVSCVRTIRKPAAVGAGLTPAVAAASDGGPVVGRPEIGDEGADLIEGPGEDGALGTGSSRVAQRGAVATEEGLALEVPALEAEEARQRAGQAVLAQHQVPHGSGMQFLKAAGWLLAATVLVYLLGFTFGLPVFIFTYLMVARMGLLRAIISAVVVGALVNIVFVHELAVTLPLSAFHSPFG